MHSDDGATAIEVVGHLTEAIPAGSVFRGVDVALEFFEQGSNALLMRNVDYRWLSQDPLTLSH